MTTEPQRGGVRGPEYWLTRIRDRYTSQTGTYRRLEVIAAEMLSEMDGHASPVKVESGEAVSEGMIDAAHRAVEEYAAQATAEQASNFHDYRRNVMRTALEAALSPRRPDNRVNSGTDSGKVGGGVG